MDNKKLSIPDCGNFTSSKCTLVNKKSTLNDVYREYTFEANSFTMLPEQLINETKECIKQILNNCVKNKVAVKVYGTMECIFDKIQMPSGLADTSVTSYFSTISVPIQGKGDIDNFFEGELIKFNDEVEKFTNLGSNWILQECKALTIRLVRFKPGYYLNHQSDDSDDDSDESDGEWRLFN